MADSLRATIEQLRQNRGGHASLCCPAHEDGRPSLSVTVDSGGKVLLKCHAGCDTAAVLAAAGLAPADLFADGQGAHDPMWTPRGPALAVYEYTDESGQPLFDVLRLPGKQFLQRRHDPAARGGYTWKLGDVRKVLYRLPTVLRAAAAGGTVYVCEGEKDVQALERAGHVATTNPGGAGKWRPEYGEALRGARVVIVADRDAPGRAHAHQVAAALRGVATSCTIVEAAQGKDAADHLAAGLGVEAFAPLAGDTPAAAVQTSATPPAETSDALPLAIRALDAPPAPPIRWTIEGVLPAGELALIAADGGVGKTTVALALAGAIAGGYPFVARARFRATAGPVLFVSEEDSEGVLLNRLEALVAGHQWERERTLGAVHLLALGGVRLNETRWQLHLLSEVERVGAVAVVLDPLFELSGGHEDSNTEQRVVIQFCRQLMRQTGATVVVVHHFGKAAEGKRKIDRVRGASAWFNAARVVFALELRDDGGLAVECLKMSRADRPRPFVLERSVMTHPEHEGTWLTATLSYRTFQGANLDRAQRFVVEHLAQAGERLTTSDLKDRAKGTGVSGADVSEAIRALHLAGQIDFEEGRKNAKLWGLVWLPDASGQPGNQTESWLPSLPGGCPATTGGPALVAHPFRGRQPASPADHTPTLPLEASAG